MILEKLGMLVCDSLRTRAYLQTMAKNQYIPKVVLIMEEIEAAPRRFEVSFNREMENLFNSHETVLETLEKVNVPYEICGTRNPNDAIVIEKIKAREEKYFIYSGPGGVILKKEILSLNKEFIHIHSGWLPEYKGSTTAYYSILKERQCSASAFFMNEELDAGRIIKRKWFKKPAPGIDTDYYYDPAIRAMLLKDVLNDYSSSGRFPEESINTREKGETYFIIHPVLKNIAILDCQSSQSKNLGGLSKCR